MKKTVIIVILKLDDI